MSAFGVSSLSNRFPSMAERRSTNAARSNAFAAGVQGADRRFNASAYDRAGMSRGAGQANAGSYAAAASMAKGIGDARSIGNEDDLFYRGQNLAMQADNSRTAMGIGQARTAADIQNQGMRNQFSAEMFGQAEARRRIGDDYRFGMMQSGWNALSGLLR